MNFIPTHSSWLNQVERFFAKIDRHDCRDSVEGDRGLKRLRGGVDNLEKDLTGEGVARGARADHPRGQTAPDGSQPGTGSVI